jgi:hypothetical protein
VLGISSSSTRHYGSFGERIFRFKHAAVVRALEREGRLTYEQVAELVSGSQLEPTPGAEDAAA